MIIALRGLLLPVLLVASLIAGCDAFTTVEMRLERAEQGLAQGDYPRAVVEAKKALQKDPDNAEARLMLAAALLQSGDVLAAEQEVEKAAAGGADAARLEPVRLDALLALGRIGAAQEVLDGATSLSEAARQTYRGRILLGRGDPAQAAVAFERAIEIDAASMDARLGRIEALALQSQLDAARAEARAILQDRPETGLAWLALGGIELRQARYGAAEEAFGKAVDNAGAMSIPQRIRARVGRIEALRLAGRLDEAFAAQSELEKVAPGSAAALLTGARLALARGEPKTAVESLRRLVQILPDQPQPRALLATALLAQGSTEQALSEAGRAVGEFPDSDEARVVLAEAQLRSGRTEDAQATLAPLIDRDEPSTAAIALAAQIELRTGHSSSGIEFLERGVDEKPGDARLKIELAGAYIAVGRPHDAVNLLNSIRDEQVSAQADLLRVIAVAASQDEASARAEIQRAVSAHPNDVQLLTLAGAYFASVDDRKLAREYMERAAAVSPGDRGAILALARLDIDEGRLDVAADRVEDVLASTPNDLAALGLMVEIASRRGEPAEVERWLQAARQSDPTAIQPRLMLLRSALVRGDNGQADDMIAEIDKLGLKQARVQVALGDVLAVGGRRPDALQRYQAAIALDSSIPEAYLGMARIQAAEKDYEAARGSLKKALALRPGWLPAAEALARVEVMDGRLDAALGIAAELKRDSPQTAGALTLEGDLLFNARRPAEAADAYAAAYSREPSGTIASRLLRARSAAGLPNPERTLLNWLEQTPGDVRARRALASYYLEAGQQGASMAEYERIVAVAPDDAVSLNNLAWLYSQNDDSRAIEMARKAYELAPASASVGDTYAWMLVQAGQVRKGLDIFEQVADKAPDNVEIQYHYAYALKADGQLDRAREVLEAALARQGGGAARPKAEALLAELVP